MLHVRRLGFSLTTVAKDNKATSCQNSVYLSSTMHMSSRRRRNKPVMPTSRGDRSIGRGRTPDFDGRAFAGSQAQQDALRSRHRAAKSRSHSGRGFELGIDLEDLARLDAAMGNSNFDPISNTIRSSNKSRFRDEVRRRIRSSALDPDAEMMAALAQMEHEMTLDTMGQLNTPDFYGRNPEQLLYAHMRRNEELDAAAERGHAEDLARRERRQRMREGRKRRGDGPMAQTGEGVDVFADGHGPRPKEKTRRVTDPDTDDDPEMQAFEELFIHDFDPSMRKRDSAGWSGLRGRGVERGPAIDPITQMCMEAEEAQRRQRTKAKKAKTKKDNPATRRARSGPGPMFGGWADESLNMESSYAQAMARDELRAMYGQAFEEGLDSDFDDSELGSDFHPADMLSMDSDEERDFLRSLNDEERAEYYAEVRRLMGDFRDPSFARDANADMGYDFMSEEEDERRGVSRGKVKPEGVVIDVDFEVTSSSKRRFSTFMGPGSGSGAAYVRTHVSGAGLAHGLGPSASHSLMSPRAGARWFASKRKAVVVAKAKTITQLQAEAESAKQKPKPAPVVMAPAAPLEVDDEVAEAMHALDALSRDQRYLQLKGLTARSSGRGDIDLSAVCGGEAGELPPGYFEDADDVDDEDLPLRKPRHAAPAQEAEDELAPEVREAAARLEDELGDDMLETDWESDFDFSDADVDAEVDENGNLFSEYDLLRPDSGDAEMDPEDERYAEKMSLIRAEQEHVRRMRGELLASELDDVRAEMLAEIEAQAREQKYGHKKRGRQREQLRSRGGSSRIDARDQLEERWRLEEEWSRDMMGMVSEGEGLALHDEGKDWASDKEVRVVGQIVGGEKIEAFEFHEKDLDERFTYGGGPGGQATNKTRNCVMLQHVPTGTIVKCHQTRSLFENRMIARKIMKRKLELIALGRDSYLGRKQARMRRRKDRRRRRYNNKVAEAEAGSGEGTSGNVGQ